MEYAARLLAWVKSRGSASVVGYSAAKIALAIWKLARCVPWLNRLTIGVRVHGHRMRIRVFSYDDLLMISDNYESAIDEVKPPKNAIVVDAGAYIGRHVLAYAEAVGPLGRVVAIEALPINFWLLEENIRLNHCRQVSCVPCALGRDCRDVLLRYGRETSTASALRELPYSVQVVQKPLDQVLRELGIDHVDFLKIDVEGAELDVLEGSQTTLAASPAARLVIEIHSFRPQDGGICPVYRWLRGRGYSIRRRYDGRRLFYVAEKPAVAAGA